MSETKVVVPDGMLEAVYEHNRAMGGDAFANDIRLDLEAALRWLSSNPIVPTREQCDEIYNDSPYNDMEDYKNRSSSQWAFAEWQRRMFRAAEPEVPEAVKDLISCPLGVEEEELQRWRVLEAYRRGQKSQTGS